MNGDWVEIGRLGDIRRLGARRVWLDDAPVAVFRTADDEVFALIDRCPHRGGPLSEGIVSERSVTCPLHNWIVELPTGCARGPDEGATLAIAVKLIGDRIFLAACTDQTPRKIAAAV